MDKGITQKNILVVGSGGANKYDYLEWLVKLGANVILIEPEEKKGASERHNWATRYTQFGNLDNVVGKAREINLNFPIYTVDTIFELTMEHAAEVRQA